MKRLIAAGAAAGALAVWAGTAVAATTTVVTPADLQGWTATDVRTGGAFHFVQDATAPGVGALQLTTDDTNAAKVQLLHGTTTALADAGELGYSTKQNAASSAVGDPSYQLAVELNGTSGFTTLVYEPYWNGTVVPDVWQSWNVGAGLFWSSSTVTCSNGTITAGAGGPPLYTLAAVEAACPDAVVIGFGVDVGTYNPGYDVETDLVDFDGTVYDFEPFVYASTKDDCKDDNWTAARRADGSSFANQGDCVSYVTSGG